MRRRQRIRPRFGVTGQGLHAGHEAREQRAVVVHVVGAAEGALGVVAQHHVHQPRLGALRLGKQRAVEGQLHQELALGRSRELGVGDLVAPGAQRRGLAIHPAQEVGVPDQRPVAQRGLVDDFGALLHGLERARRLVVDAAAARRNVHHHAALRLQPPQVGPLVLVALARDQLGRLIRRRFASAHGCVAQRLEIERCEVLAFEIGDQIGRRENDGALDLLHRRSAPPSSRR